MKSPLGDGATPDEVETAFYNLLRQVAAERRVVVLLDALDQFEVTMRGRHLTWLKAWQCPPNVRLLATGLPCPAVDALSDWRGIEVIELPPLCNADTAGIGNAVWGRYHRELNPAVLQVLLEKTLPGDAPACGNPLWLTLALEQLNLLDADDFVRAERDYTGPPTERMTVLLLETAGRMPADIGALYGWLLAQNEKAFGVAHTRGFAVAIALQPLRLARRRPARAGSPPRAVALSRHPCAGAEQPESSRHCAAASVPISSAAASMSDSTSSTRKCATLYWNSAPCGKKHGRTCTPSSTITWKPSPPATRSSALNAWASSSANATPCARRASLCDG